MRRNLKEHDMNRNIRKFSLIKVTHRCVDVNFLVRIHSDEDGTCVSLREESIFVVKDNIAHQLPLTQLIYNIRTIPITIPITDDIFSDCSAPRGRGL